MTKKEFKRTVQCGLGRCVQELQTTQNLEKYRDIVLWACTHESAYDAQCEGPKSRHLYEMVKCFPDRQPFVEAAAVYFDKNIFDYGWGFSYACCFLELAAQDGNLYAAGILKKYFGMMYEMLKHPNRHISEDIPPLCYNFSVLCISVVRLAHTEDEWEKRYFKVMEELGFLFLKNPRLCYWHFETFQWYGEDKCGKANIRRRIKEKAKNNRGIQSYLSSMEKQEEYWKNEGDEPRRKKQEALTADNIYHNLKEGGRVGRTVPIMAASMMLKKGKTEEVRELTAYYQKETDLSLRSQLLRLLEKGKCPEFLDAKTVIRDSRSEDECLRENAFLALQSVRDKKVHDYAIELLDRKERTEDVICLLANNYQKEDHDILVSLVTSLPVTYKENISWHGPFMAILDMFKRGGSKHLPKELLPYIYENTLCSCCRFSAVREMSRRRMLTEDIIRECLYDSYEDTREFAKTKGKYKDV